MTPLRLAWLNLTQQRVRTFVSLVGVAFAVLLLFMQLGFLDAVGNTASLVYDQLDFDLLILSREYISLANPAAFSRDRLGQARGIPGVESVWPVTAVLGEWRDPRANKSDPDGPRRQHSIMILAVPPAGLEAIFRRRGPPVFPSVQAEAEDAVQLARLDTVLFDRTSRSEFGDAKRWARDPYNELNGRRVEVIGVIQIGTGFAYNGLVLTSEATLTRITGWPEQQVCLGLVKVKPGTSVRRVQAELQKTFGADAADVEVFNRRGIVAKEEEHWLSETAVGQFFKGGVLIALLVGGVFVYQMMTADIARRLAEYATIRALGYQGWYLSAVVFWQGLFLAVVGYVPGFAVALVCYWWTREGAGIPIAMTALRTVGVLGLTVLMCMGSSLLAVRGVHRANPADLF